MTIDCEYAVNKDVTINIQRPVDIDKQLQSKALIWTEQARNEKKDKERYSMGAWTKLD